MSARTNLVVNDRAATPVAHTFTPDGDDKNDVHLFSEKTAFMAGNPVYSISYQKASRFKPAVRLKVPVVATQTINGVATPTIVRYAQADLNFSFDLLSTEQERADLVGMLVNSLAASQTQINDLIVKASDIY